MTCKRPSPAVQLARDVLHCEESPIKCAKCHRDHHGGLAKRCGVAACECYCNRSTAPPAAARRRVLYKTSFSYDAKECISHVTVDGIKTACGRAVASADVVEPDDLSDPPDCRMCARALLRATRKARP